MLIDTHCHLNFPDFEKDLDQVIKNSLNASVEKIINVGADLNSSQKAIEIAQKYESCFAAVGIHPHHADKIEKGWEEKLKDLAKQPKVVAIGEIGLDYYEYESNGIVDPEIQKEIFSKQMGIAQKLKLPVIFHSRESANEMFSLIKPPTTGVFHCYAAGKRGIEKVINLGLFFGLDGNLTYDQGLQIVAQKIPLERIILETDSPLLTPIPFRGQRNEPKNVTLICECLAKIKGVSQEEVAQITSQNANNLCSFP
ncbi:MAG: TatD family hydrolase [Candidatus Gottesmanbacteria bacterium]